MRDQIFISYSHLDELWRQRIVTHLTPWVRKKKFDPWDDKRIPPGAKWYQQIVEALDRSTVAILLVTPSFLQSEFIENEEMARILRSAETRGLKIFWIYVSSCAYRASLLKDYQAANDTSRPLDLLSNDGQINAELARICETLASQFPDLPPDPPVLTQQQTIPPDAPSVKPHVVLLYKRNAETDEQVMTLVNNSLASQGLEVFVDRNMAIGREWVKEIERQLRDAEAVIPLISEVSVKSEMLTFELQIAQEAARD